MGLHGVVSIDAANASGPRCPQRRTGLNDGGMGAAVQTMMRRSPAMVIEETVKTVVAANRVRPSRHPRHGVPKKNFIAHTAWFTVA
jgi:hypothetical protein